MILKLSGEYVKDASLILLLSGEYKKDTHLHLLHSGEYKNNKNKTDEFFDFEGEKFISFKDRG